MTDKDTMPIDYLEKLISFWDSQSEEAKKYDPRYSEGLRHCADSLAIAIHDHKEMEKQNGEVE